MIKLFAMLSMLIDHIGVVIFPQNLLFRVIGRLSMPLFAYCTARGFYYSKQHGTVRKYLMNMLIFALVSQLPYHLMVGEGLNIGFTWLLSLLLLVVFTSKKRNHDIMGGLLLMVVFGSIEILLPVDYGIYGVVIPLLFYFLLSHNRETGINYVLILVVAWTFYVLVNRGSFGSMIQLASVGSAFILAECKKQDNKIRLPKWICYSFYPVHMMVLLLLRYIV